MDRDIIEANIEAGLIPIGLCVHDGTAELNPFHCTVSRMGWLFHCTKCGSVTPASRVHWHTTQELAERFGWRFEAPEGRYAD